MATITTKVRTYVATYADGSQLLVTIYPTGLVTVATRSDKWSTWGRPTECEDMTWGD